MIDPSDSSIPVVPAPPPRPAGLPWRAWLRRWGPYAATGLAMLLVGLLLGATLFASEPAPAAAVPCKDEPPEAELIEATATPPSERPVKRKPGATRPRSESGSAGGGGHF